MIISRAKGCLVFEFNTLQKSEAEVEVSSWCVCNNSTRPDYIRAYSYVHTYKMMSCIEVEVSAL